VRALLLQEGRKKISSAAILIQLGEDIRGGGAGLFQCPRKRRKRRAVNQICMYSMQSQNSNHRGHATLPEKKYG